VQEILEKGDVNLLEVKDENGNTALHKAIDGAHLGVIRLLVEKNIELLNVQNAAGKAVKLIHPRILLITKPLL